MSQPDPEPQRAGPARSVIYPTVAILVIAGLLIAGLVALATYHPGVGPLSGEYPATVAKTELTECIPQSGPNDSVADGLVLLGPIRGTATIKSVSLWQAQDLTLIGAFTVPIVDHKGGGYTLVGEQLTYPLTAQEIKALDPSVVWDQHRPAIGSVIGHDQINLVLGLHTAAKMGSSTGVQVVYSSGGHTYKMLAAFGTSVIQPGGQCRQGFY